MNYPDTDTTQTDWSESGQRNPNERCPITGVSMAPGLMPVEYSGDARVAGHRIHKGRSESKLQAMFDKFLYQR